MNCARNTNIIIMIEVDGGIDDAVAKECADAGADIIVMGSHLFRR